MPICKAGAILETTRPVSDPKVPKLDVPPIPYAVTINTPALVPDLLNWFIVSSAEFNPTAPRVTSIQFSPDSNVTSPTSSKSSSCCLPQNDKVPPRIVMGVVSGIISSIRKRVA